MELILFSSTWMDTQDNTIYHAWIHSSHPSNVRGEKPFGLGPLASQATALTTRPCHLSLSKSAESWHRLWSGSRNRQRWRRRGSRAWRSSPPQRLRQRVSHAHGHRRRHRNPAGKGRTRLSKTAGEKAIGRGQK